MHKVKYAHDQFEEDLEEEEVKDMLINKLSTEGDKWMEFAIKGIQGGFDYLEDRLTGNCRDCYDCSNCYQVCEIVQVFDPLELDK